MNKSIGILLLLAVTSAQAEPDALVQAVQMPAWLQRDAKTTPLRVGAALRNGDKLITGANARIYVKTADGSTVKLGENATLALDGLSQTREEQSLFNAVLDVAKGAFRFTTSGLAKLKARDVTVKVAGATIGIRGTDVWGKDGSEQGVVCLIEGKIDVTGIDNKQFVMDQPLSFYKMPKGAAPLPVGPVDAEQLKKWAVETEIAQPAMHLGGKWKVDLLTSTDERAALAAYDQWRTAGYDVRLKPVAREGGWIYTVRIPGLSDRAEAEKLAALLKGMLGAENPSVSR
ncbi:MAG: FecR domain-containing protein [Nitrosomonadales bacterium]|nr:FecR domain-containing protein [Nitrosomonadales bacterium]